MKKRIFILCLIGFFLTVILGGAFCALKPDWVFLVEDTLSHFGEKPQLTNFAILDSESYTWEELRNDPRITENQAMMLINETYPLPSDFVPHLNTTKEYNVCAEHAFKNLQDAMKRRFDKSLRIMSAYRTETEQKAVLVTGGEYAAAPGTSEHQAGLALDLYIPYYAGAAFLKSDIGQAVNRDAYRYGFIVRYPYYGESETGIPFEPWHIRYVGRPHAELISEGRITLETYMDSILPDHFYRYGDTVITCQTEEPFQLPTNFVTATVSPDNRGNYIFTVQIPSSQ